MAICLGSAEARENGRIPQHCRVVQGKSLMLWRGGPHLREGSIRDLPPRCDADERHERPSRGSFLGAAALASLMLDWAVMKSCHSSIRLPSLRRFGIITVLALVAACNRKSEEPVPSGTTPPEVPVVPRVEPAKPAQNEVAEPAPLAEPGTSPQTVTGEQPLAGDAKHREAKAKFKAAPNSKLSGAAKLEETATGVKFVIDVESAPTGKKGMHVHEKGDCSDIPGKSMGEHFAPSAKSHGLPPNPSRHLGDLGNIQIEKDGKAHFEFTASGANLKENDPMSFLGRAIVIHESDDKGGQPSGDSGKPMACAVIEKD